MLYVAATVIVGTIVAVAVSGVLDAASVSVVAPVNQWNHYVRRFCVLRQSTSK